jgi:hypothetical protein
MQIGLITVDGRPIGTITWTEGDTADTFAPSRQGVQRDGQRRQDGQGRAA